jgi:anti-sigma regulatory factor (Ser/Thr protein kinase)
VQASHRFPPRLESAREARRFVESLLDRWQVEPVSDAALLTSELVANCIIHARGDIDVRVREDGDRLRVEVADRDRDLPTPRPLDPAATRGRGLAIVDALADRWGTAPAPRGKVVWFELRERPRAARAHSPRS